jgi:AcrR family transcriptional regulator
MAGRPREFDRDEALAKARDAFWTQGYEGIAISDLVTRLGLASSRIYAAFGSKEQLFREAVALYRDGEGGAPLRALAEAATVREGLERMLEAAAQLYTRPGRPRGCMVVVAATNCSSANQAVAEGLAEFRRARGRAIAERLGRAVAEGELEPGADVQALADHFATVLSGFSVQARDGLSRSRLRATIPAALAPLDRAPRAY